MVRDRQGRNRGSNPAKNARKLSMLQKTIWQRLSGKGGYKSGEGTQVKVVALMRWGVAGR